MDDLLKTFKISASGMKAQGTRLRVISENIANADSLPRVPGQQPYRRKLVKYLFTGFVILHHLDHCVQMSSCAMQTVKDLRLLIGFHR